MARSKVIYLGIKGSIVALDATDGRQLWATHLKGSDFVNVVLDGDVVYGATHGEIFCLDARTGDGLWSNPLKGFGFGLVGIATESMPAQTLAHLVTEYARQEQQRRSSD